MAYVYILYSEKLGKFYTGSCLDYAGRLQEHKMRADSTSFTAKADDWDEFFVIPDLSKHQARSIEKHISCSSVIRPVTVG